MPFLAAVIKDVVDNRVDKDIRTTVNKIKADIKYLKDRTLLYRRLKLSIPS